jgi:hypothetical protein
MNSSAEKKRSQEENTLGQGEKNLREENHRADLKEMNH